MLQDIRFFLHYMLNSVCLYSLSKKTIGRGYADFKSKNDYVVRLFKQVFFCIILVFFDALRTLNYSLEELLFKSCKMQTGLHKHHFYIYRTDFAMK